MKAIKKEYSLKDYNTFGFGEQAKYFVRVDQIKLLTDCLQWAEEQNVSIFILGGGSNILLTQSLDKLVIKNDIKGIEVVGEDNDFIDVKIGGGEIWHDTVLTCISKGWGGVENLSLIPGSVGAAPIQNIGAYGVELKDVFLSLEALNIKTKQIETFEKSVCEFGYRTSIFKTHKKGEYVITSVTLRLTKKHTLNTLYGAIDGVLYDKGISSPSIKDISDAVIAIRAFKLPDPKVLGNSGSFFKNPVIAKSAYLPLKEQYDIPGYTVNDLEMKVPAGWLIEKAGWKGKRVGAVGVHAQQALVLVNYGDGRGVEVLELARSIQKSVKEKFGIEIEPEVNLI